MASITADELALWQAYDAYFEPIGHQWRQSSLIAASVANFSLRSKRGIKPDSFVPVLKRKPEKPSELQNKQVALQLHRFFQSEVARGSMKLERDKYKPRKKKNNHNGDP